MTPQRTPNFMTGLALLVPITLSVMAIVLLAPILPLLLEEFKTEPGFEYWVPMVLTVPALCVAIFSPIAGMLGDAYGRRRLLLWSFVVYAILGVMPVFLTSLWAILASRVGVGVAEAVIMVMSTTLIGDFFKGEARDKWLAAQTAFASLSALLFFNIGGQLGRFGWQAPFWVYLSALAMLVLVLIYTWEPEAKTDAEADQAQTGWDGFPWGRMAAIIGITIFGSTLFYTVQIQAPNGLNALGSTDPGTNGFWTSIASSGVLVGTYLFSRIVKWPVKRLLLTEFAILAVGFTVMSTATAPMQFLVGCFINQVGAGLLLPTLLVWAMSILPYGIRSRGAGMWTGAFTFGQWISPIAVTFFASQLGGLIAAFLGMAALAAAGVVIAALGKFRRGVDVPAAAAAHG